MATLNLTDAAKACGKNRSTLWRMIQRGHLSASRNERKEWVIEAAELARVFGKLEIEGNDLQCSETVDSNEMQYPAMDKEAWQAIVENLKEQLKDAKIREKRLLDLLEQEQQARQQLEMKLLPPAQGDAMDKQHNATGKKGILAWLFGK